MQSLRKPYTTIAETFEFEIEPIKHSRFIAHAQAVGTDEEAAMVFIESIRQRYPDARHHCWAYQLREAERVRFSDDGEPGGSAGRPMLSQLQGREVFDIIVVVVRYFGGTKLGVGGLMRAYGGAVAQLLDRAPLRTVIPTLPLWLEYDYSDTSSVEAMFADMKLQSSETNYGEAVSVCLQVPDADILDLYDRLKTQVGGRIRLMLPDGLEASL
ncbi:IMPACT family protein [Leucothrix pacifica]|uniref:IMPACT family protein n=1 Tax=Leucothrix pacifica TaxID=1247513 RepID=UPI0015E841E6|nr:YigZ family protein [Leucothrix pacifica]